MKSWYLAENTYIHTPTGPVALDRLGTGLVLGYENAGVVKTTAKLLEVRGNGLPFILLRYGNPYLEGALLLNPDQTLLILKGGKSTWVRAQDLVPGDKLPVFPTELHREYGPSGPLSVFSTEEAQGERAYALSTGTGNILVGPFPLLVATEVLDGEGNME